MRIITDTQGDLAWWMARRGVPTASELHKIICTAWTHEVQLEGEKISGHNTKEAAIGKAAALAKKDGKPYDVVSYIPTSAQAENYAIQLIADRDDPFYEQKFDNDAASLAMKNGVAMEPQSRRFYEYERGVNVHQTGLCIGDFELMPSWSSYFGFSPDALIAVEQRPDGSVIAEGALELKNPALSTHLRWLREFLLTGEMPAEHLQQVHGALIIGNLKWVDFLSHSPCPKYDHVLVRVTPNEYTDQLRNAMAWFAGLLWSIEQSFAPAQLKAVA